MANEKGQEKEFGFVGRFWEGQLAREKPPVFKFARMQVVQPVEAREVRLLTVQGLRVPTNAVAVLVKRDGETLTYPAGVHTVQLRSGFYELFFVDASKRSTTLPNVRGLSSDGLDVTLDLRLYWYIDKPQMLINVEDPLGDFIQTCLGITRGFVRQHMHDELVPMLGRSPYTIPELNNRLASQLRSQREADGFQLLQAHILDVVPDLGRKTAIQKVNRRISQLEEEITVQQKEAERQREELRQEMNQRDPQTVLEQLKAHLEKRVAEERELLEVIKRGVRTEAEQVYLADRLKDLYPTAQPDHVLKLMHLLASMQDSSGASANLTDTTWDTVAALIQEPHKTPPERARSHATNGDSADQGGTLADRLFKELQEAIKLPKVTRGDLVMNADGSVSAVVLMAGYELTVECDKAYPFNGPRRIQVTSGNRILKEIKLMLWNESSGLRDVVLQAHTQLAMSPPDGGARRKGPPVAG